MSSEFITASILVDTSLVVNEISEDSEGSFNWTVIHDFGLDLAFSVSNRVDFAGELKIVIVVQTIFACFGALRGGGFTLAWFQGSVNMVVACWERVWLAPFIGNVV